MSLNTSLIKKKIILRIEYKNQLSTINANPYNKLGEIREMASNKFYGIKKKDVHLFYKNQDLKEKENEEIGEYFSNRELVSLKLDYPEIHTNSLSSNKNSFHENKEQKLKNLTHVSPNNLMSLKKANLTNLKLPKINYFNKRKIAHIISNYNDNQLYSKKNEPIKINEYTPNLKRHTKKLTITPNNNSFNKNKNKNHCSNCKVNSMSFYCRNCQKFLCSKCRENKEHNSHLMIQINENNLKETIELYANLLETDIEENINQNENFLIDFGEKNFSVNIENKQDVIIKKLKYLTNIYIKLIHFLENKYLKEETEKNIEQYNSSTKQISINIKNILNAFNKNKKNLNFQEIKNYFKQINEIENEYNELNKNILIYKLNNSVNYRINCFYEEINDNIDKLININSIFDLDKKSIELLNNLNFNINKKISVQFDESVYNNLSKSRDNINSILHNKKYIPRQYSYSNDKNYNYNIYNNNNNNNNNNDNNNNNQYNHNSNNFNTKNLNLKLLDSDDDNSI